VSSISSCFSIVIATLNRKEMLLRALDSVYAQAFDVQIIVADGGSTDGTLDAIQALPNITLLKGPDQGLYHAFNKGLAKARGDIVGILNSDDLYEPGAFAVVEQAFSRNATADAVCGTATLADGSCTLEIYDDEASKRLTPRAALIGSCVLNARFFRRSTLTSIGPFDLQYSFVADRDFLARCYEAHMTTVPIRERVYCYRHHSESLTFNDDPERKLAIHTELLRLARAWRRADHASGEMRRMALNLEGRCIAKLARAQIRQGRLAGGFRHLVTDDGRLSLTPSLAVIAGGADWLSQCLARPAALVA
jgi:glycosyltransferase involved in cell wall biosynthesis